MKKPEPRTISDAYKCYRFDPDKKNPIIFQIKTIVQDLKVSYQALAEGTGHSYSCVWNIFEGATKDPRHSTLARIVIFLGHADMAMVPENKPKLRAITGGKKASAA